MNINTFEGIQVYNNLEWIEEAVHVAGVNFTLMLPYLKCPGTEFTDRFWGNPALNFVKWYFEVKGIRTYVGVLNTVDQWFSQYPIVLDFWKNCKTIDSKTILCRVGTPSGSHPGVPSTILIDSLGEIVKSLDFPQRRGFYPKTKVKVILLDPKWNQFGWNVFKPIIGLQFLEGKNACSESKTKAWQEYLLNNKLTE